MMPTCIFQRTTVVDNCLSLIRPAPPPSPIRLFAVADAKDAEGPADLKTTQIYTRVAIRQLQEIHRATHPAKLKREKRELQEPPGCQAGSGGSMIKEEPSAMAEYNYAVMFEPAEEGGFVVTCPALPGLVTEGDTLEESRRMALDAIRAYLESLHKDHVPIPADRQPVQEEIRVLLPESA